MKCENPIVSPYSVVNDNISDEYSASSMNPTSYVKLQFNKQFIIVSYVLAIHNASNTYSAYTTSQQTFVIVKYFLAIK